MGGQPNRRPVGPVGVQSDARAVGYSDYRNHETIWWAAGRKIELLVGRNKIPVPADDSGEYWGFSCALLNDDSFVIRKSIIEEN